MKSIETIVKHQIASGKSFREIEKATGISKSTAWRVVNKPPGVAKPAADRAHTLRMKKRRAAIWKLAMKESIRVATVIAEKYRQQHGVAVPITTVRRDLRAKFRCRARPRGPKHLPGDPQKRLTAAKYLRRRKAVYTDEKYFELRDSGVRMCYVADGEDAPHRGEPNFAPKLHVWAAIGPGRLPGKPLKLLVIHPKNLDQQRHGRYHDYSRKKRSARGDGETRGRRLRRFAETKKGRAKRSGVDSERYLDSCIVPLAKRWRADVAEGAVLVQDGASCHTSQVTLDYINDKTPIELAKHWSPRSPDLNIIENAWSALSYGVCGPVYNFTTPKDLNELEERLKAEFARFDVSGLLGSVQRRCDECIRLGGKLISSRWRVRARKSDYELLRGGRAVKRQ